MAKLRSLLGERSEALVAAERLAKEETGLRLRLERAEKARPRPRPNIHKCMYSYMHSFPQAADGAFGRRKRRYAV